MRKSSHRSQLIKFAGIGLGALLAFGLIGVATIMTLRKFDPKTRPQAAQTSQQQLSSAEVIDAFARPGVIAALSDTKYDQRGGTAGGGSVTYMLDREAYAVTAPTKDNLLYYSKNLQQPDDTAAVQEQAASFMDGNGLQEIRSPASAAAANLATVTYENEQTVCQLTDAKGAATGQMPRYHTLACVKKADVKKEYDAVKKLLALSGPHTLAFVPQAVRRDTNTEANKAYAILTVTGATNTQARLLYAAVDGKWEYLGNLDAGDKRYAGAKYTVTPEIAQKISDPKYGGFLQRFIH